MRLASRVGGLAPSATLAMSARADALRAAGRDLVSFGAGEPDFDTPGAVVEAMAAAARSGATRYGPAGGIAALRAAVATQFSERYGVAFRPDEVVVTVGGKHGLYELFQVLVDPGDEVLVPTPAWVSYPAQIQLAGGVPVTVETRLEERYAPSVEALESRIGPRTVGLVLNSPNNPTGEVLEPGALRAIAEVVERHDLWVVTDDIYSDLRYDPGPYPSLLRERPDLRGRVCVVHGTSKSYAMTGWRIGFVGAPAEVSRKLVALQGQITGNPNTFAQHGALAAVTGDQGFLADWLAAYDARRRRMAAALDALDGVRCPLPRGAFYCFADVRGLLARRHGGAVIGTSQRLADLLLEEAGVVTVAGDPFGAPGFLRLSYACAMADIERGLGRVEAFVAAVTP